MRALVLLGLGVLLGILGAIVSAQRIAIGAVLVPTGTILALAVLVPIARAAAWWLQSRMGALALGIGWLIGTLAMGTGKPWGDLILDSGTRQLAYLVIGSTMLAASATFPLVDPAPVSPAAEVSPEEPLMTVAPPATPVDPIGDPDA